MKRTIAKAIKLEINETTDELLLVFRVTDADYKKMIRENWNLNYEFELIKKEK